MRVGGIDEVGLGAVAGGIVTTAIVLNTNFSSLHQLRKWWPLKEVRDSKTTTESYREQIQTLLMEFLEESEARVGVGIASASLLNKRGYPFAWKTAMQQAALEASIGGPNLDYFIIDGPKRFPGLDGRYGRVIAEPKADANYFLVALASIIAKLIRDQQMAFLSLVYPQYGWDRNRGYGTAEHKQAIEKYGLSPLHRVKPCATMLRKTALQ